MERGRLFYHYLDEEEITCESDGATLDGEPRFKVCVIGDDERIELRNLTVKDLEALRDKLGAAIAAAPRKESATAGQVPVAPSANSARAD